MSGKTGLVCYVLLTPTIVVVLAELLSKTMACFVRNTSISSRPRKVCETSEYLRLQRWTVGCLNSLEMVCGNKPQRQIINMNTDYGLGDASGNIGTTQRFVDSRPLSSVGQSIAEVEARCQRADTVARATNSAPTTHQDTTSAYSELLKPCRAESAGRSSSPVGTTECFSWRNSMKEVSRRPLCF